MAHVCILTANQPAPKMQANYTTKEQDRVCVHAIWGHEGDILNLHFKSLRAANDFATEIVKALDDLWSKTKSKALAEATG